ncbi:MAG: heavy metal transporter [Flavobacteriaceae bacterium]
MKLSLAKIPVQNKFCGKCSSQIKSELLKIRDITNVYLYPTDSLVVFSFVKANELSTALNILTALGYPPQGDRIKNKCQVPFCSCI